MSPTGLNVMEHLSVLAIVRGGRALVLDRHGRPISSRQIALDRITGEIDRGALDDWAWLDAANRMTRALVGKVSSRFKDPWRRRAEALETSIRLRARDDQRRRTRSTLDKFPTHTWDEAGHRMAQQGLSSYRWHSRSGWQRWAQTATNNFNRRRRGERCQTPRP